MSAQQPTVRQRQAGGGRVAAIAATTFCCLPCLCVCAVVTLIGGVVHAAAHYERPSTRRKREARQQQESFQRRERIHAPKVLGPRLEGSLTIGKQEMVNTDISKQRLGATLAKNTDQQLQSPLFMLPLEVRRQIYEEVIGGYTIHIYHLEAYKRMGHVRCKDSCSEFCTARSMYKQKGAPDSVGNISLLAPLLSCRRIYSEAIEILYKSNIFDFDYLGNVLKLSLMILPERMRLIKSVQWDYYHEYGLLQAIATIKSDGMVPVPNVTTATPWYNCRAPKQCPCLDCWSKFYFNDFVNHKFIIYDWIMPER